MLSLLAKLKKALTQINTRTVYFYSLLTGIITGSIAALFYSSIHAVMHFSFNVLAKMPGTEVTDLVISESTSTLKFVVFLLPVLGGLITGLLLYFFDPDSQGGGTDTFLDAFHHKAGVLKKRTAMIKFLASTSTLGTGGSGGKEGPMLLIGSALGSLIGRFIKMGARARRTLLLAGAAGGLGAIFRTPLGGAITAVEVLYKEDFESDALIPCIISSVTAYTTFGIFQGFGHSLNFSASFFHSPVELIFYALLALFCTLAAYFFVKVYSFLGDFFNRLPVPRYCLPAIGGLLLSCVAVFYPETLGGGLSVIQQAINGSFSLDWITTCRFFLVLAILKIFTTSFTIQSGGSAGTLIPCFFIGAMLGGAVGTVFHNFFPETIPSVTPFIVVGMAAFFAAATNASLGALVMVTEMTGGYELLPALMVVAVISLIFSHKWSIYRNQVSNKFYSKAHLWDMNPAILKNIQIASAFSTFHNEAILGHKSHLSQIRCMAHKYHDTEFLVVDDNKKLLGTITLHDLDFDDVENNPDLNDLLVAEDMLHGDPQYITPQDSLFKAISFLTNTDFSKIPVVDESYAKTKLLGYLTRKDILNFYNNLGVNKS